MSTTIPKDPNAVLDYGWDWATWLAGDTIVASTWIAPVGLVVESDAFTDTTTSVWLSGGTQGVTYAVSNRITTAAGRIEDRSLAIQVVDR
jgi:hypothetical protein